MSIEELTEHLATIIDASEGPGDNGYIDAHATGDTMAVTHTDEEGNVTNYHLEVSEL